MKKLSVDLDMLIEMMDSHNYEIFSYLDKETGEVLIFTEDMVPDELRELEKEELEELLKDENETTRIAARELYEIDNDNTDRYEFIPELPSRVVYKRMEEFVCDIEDIELREKVLYKIKGKGAFRRFKDFLDYHEEYKQPWFDIRDKLLEEKATEWLNSIGIEPINKPMGEADE